MLLKDWGRSFEDQNRDQSNTNIAANDTGIHEKKIVIPSCVDSSWMQSEHIDADRNAQNNTNKKVTIHRRMLHCSYI
ncbi:hypothetical protein TNCV_1824591 [Trichonephila clavipes]|nr:hypothetical protein TNCV_1824591 [Trichonephila clavipes]